MSTKGQVTKERYYKFWPHFPTFLVKWGGDPRWPLNSDQFKFSVELFCNPHKFYYHAVLEEYHILLGTEFCRFSPTSKICFSCSMCKYNVQSMLQCTKCDVSIPWALLRRRNLKQTCTVEASSWCFRKSWGSRPSIMLLSLCIAVAHPTLHVTQCPVPLCSCTASLLI